MSTTYKSTQSPIKILSNICCGANFISIFIFQFAKELNNKNIETEKLFKKKSKIKQFSCESCKNKFLNL